MSEQNNLTDRQRAWQLLSAEMRHHIEGQDVADSWRDHVAETVRAADDLTEFVIQLSGFVVTFAKKVPGGLPWVLKIVDSMDSAVMQERAETKGGENEREEQP